MMRTWERGVAPMLGLGLGANGTAMLAAPLAWYEFVPGVLETGPWNGHFVRDVGAAYLVAGLGLIAFGVWPRTAWPALAASAGFLSLHGLVHVYDTVCGRTDAARLAADFPGVILPALIACALTAAALARGT